MDGGQGPPPQYQAGPEIPVDIFQPLLAIAQRQYDPDDVKRYYLIMLRHLRRMGASNADVAYSLMTPISDRKVSVPPSEPSSEEGRVSPKTNPVFEDSFEPSYEPGQNDQLHIATRPGSAYPVLQTSQAPPPQMNIPGPPPMMMDYSPASSSSAVPNNDMTATTVGPSPYMFAPQPAPQPTLQQWYPQQAYGVDTSPPPLPPRAATTWPSPGPPYDMPMPMPMPRHAMSYPGPYQQPPPPMQQQQYYHEDPEGSLLDRVGDSLGLGELSRDLYSSAYFPMIDVIPSRKRKALQKGVRRITQGIPLPRPS